MQPQTELAYTGFHPGFPAIIHIAIYIAEEGFVSPPLLGIEPDAERELLVRRPVAVGMQAARCDGTHFPRREDLLFPIERREEFSRLDGEGFGLVLVPVVGRVVDRGSRALRAADYIFRAGVHGEEFGTGGRVLGGVCAEVGALGARWLGDEEGEHCFGKGFKKRSGREVLNRYV